MTLNSSSTNNMLLTTTADLHEKPAEAIGKESPKIKKNQYSIA